MADILSRDEIDRLLQASSDQPSPSERKTAQWLKPVRDEIFSATRKSLNLLLARSVEVTTAGVVRCGFDDLEVETPLVVKFKLKSGFDGALGFAIGAKEGSMIADLILGGEGAASDPVQESDLDAVKEIFSQIMGKAAPTLSKMLGADVALGSARLAHPGDGGSASDDGWDDGYVAEAKLSVDDVFAGPLYFVVPAGLAGALAPGQTDGGSTPDSNATQPAPAVPAQKTSLELPADIRNIDLILDIEVEVMVRLGEAEMPLRDIQRLRPGSIIDLDKDTDALVELVVNDKVIAKGELVVVNSDHFALRVVEISSPAERIKTLGGT